MTISNMPDDTLCIGDTQLKLSNITIPTAMAGPDTRGDANSTSNAIGKTCTENATPRSSTPAADNVLKTTEPLEMILVRVDVKTLLLAQRVAPVWRANVTSSKVLQKKLFFLPATREELPGLNIVAEGKLSTTLPKSAETKRSFAQRSHNVLTLGFRPTQHRPRGLIDYRQTVVYNPLVL